MSPLKSSSAPWSWSATGAPSAGSSLGRRLVLCARVMTALRAGPLVTEVASSIYCRLCVSQPEPRPGSGAATGGVLALAPNHALGRGRAREQWPIRDPPIRIPDWDVDRIELVSSAYSWPSPTRCHFGRTPRRLHIPAGRQASPWRSLGNTHRRGAVSSAPAAGSASPAAGEELRRKPRPALAALDRRGSGRPSEARRARRRGPLRIRFTPPPAAPRFPPASAMRFQARIRLPGDLALRSIPAIPMAASPGGDGDVLGNWLDRRRGARLTGARVGDLDPCTAGSWSSPQSRWQGRTSVY